MDMEPRAFEIYRHFKGNLYQIITLAEDTETGEKLVVYQGMYEPFKIYARPLSMFTEKLDHAKYPGAVQEYRFERIQDMACASNTQSVLPAADSQQKEVAAPVNTPAVFKEVSEEPGKDDIDPYLMQFLDADTPEKKLEALSQIKAFMTPKMLTAMELSQGMEPQESWTLEKRYRQIKNDIIMKQKYERPHR